MRSPQRCDQLRLAQRPSNGDVYPRQRSTLRLSYAERERTSGAVEKSGIIGASARRKLPHRTAAYRAAPRSPASAFSASPHRHGWPVVARSRRPASVPVMPLRSSRSAPHPLPPHRRATGGGGLRMPSARARRTGADFCVRAKTRRPADQHEGSVPEQDTASSFDLLTSWGNDFLSRLKSRNRQ